MELKFSADTNYKLGDDVLKKYFILLKTKQSCDTDTILQNVKLLIYLKDNCFFFSHFFMEKCNNLPTIINF